MSGGSEGVLVGVRGQYEGKAIPIAAGDRVALGRDPAMSHIVFDRTCRLVSRKHCVVCYQAHTDAYQVTDYSRNGTFLESGGMLMPLVPVTLPRGTVLCLGSCEQAILLQ